MSKSTSVIQLYGDNKSLLDDVLNSSARLYRIKVIEEVGKVYFFFNISESSQNKTWKLSLFISPGIFKSATDINFSDFLKRTVKQELKGLHYPEKIDIILPYILDDDCNTSPQLARQSLSKVVDLVEMILPNWNIEDFQTKEYKNIKQIDTDFMVRPRATNLLVILLSLIFLIQTTMTFIDPDFLKIGWIGVNSLNMALGNYIGIIGGTLIHGNLLHFLMNLFALYYLGIHLSRFYNFSRFILIYVLSTIAGVLGSLAFAEANSIGSSGSIFGLLGALMIALWNVRPKTEISDYWNFQFNYLLRSLYICLILSLLIPIIVPRIDVWGHLGGFLGGLFISLQLSKTNWRFKVGSWIILIFISVPWLYQLRDQYTWATKILDQRQNQRAASERLVLEMNGRLSDITHYIKILLDFRAEDVQALHLQKVDTMRTNFEFIKKQKEFLGQNLLKRYFDCIDEGLHSLTVPRKSGYGNNWLQRYSELEREVLQYYGLARSEEN